MSPALPNPETARSPVHISPISLTAKTLARYPLPQQDPKADKEMRGHILVIAGCREIPGAAILAATAALRSGAGKLTIATAASIAAAVGIAVPESRVIGLNETSEGAVAELQAHGANALTALVRKVDAVLIGPGMQDESCCCDLVRQIIDIFSGTPIVLDALAMSIVRDGLPFKEPLLLTPHAGEMAHLTGIDRADILADPVQAATDAAVQWNAVVALKGAKTIIATPEKHVWIHESSNAGLATSGSGDILAGILGGLAARELPLLHAALWGVVLHSQAGTRLTLRHGAMGYLARDIGAEIPGLLHEFEIGETPV